MVVPKFRAWDKVSRAWRRDVYIGLDGLAKDLSRTGEEPFELPLDNVVIMQSTGLFDKNGEEIFEGDVVKLKYTVLSDYEFFKVTKFRGGSWRIDDRQRGCELWLRNEECEIIGSIYENPELVEG